jgi:hypothetical protein
VYERRAIAGFARLAMVEVFDLLFIWAAESNKDAVGRSDDSMNSNQFRNWLAAIGLGRTLRMYDDALHTEFEDEFNNRLQKLIEFATEELDDEESPE